MRKFITIAEGLRLTPAQSYVDSIMQLNDTAMEIEVAVYGPTTVEIETIWNHGERGNGNSSHVLRTMVEKADELGITLRLIPHYLVSHNDDGEMVRDDHLQNDQLRDWYARYGFKETGEMAFDDPVMERQPR